MARKKAAAAVELQTAALPTRWGGAEFSVWMTAMGWRPVEAAHYLGLSVPTIYRLREKAGPVDVTIQLSCMFLMVLHEQGDEAMHKALAPLRRKIA